MHIQLNDNFDLSHEWAGLHVNPAIFTDGGGFDCGDLTISSTASISGGAIGSACSYTVNTGTSSVGSPLCTCFSANGTGVGTVIGPCPVHSTLTFPANPNTFIPATSPNWTVTWPSPVIEDKCYICRDEIKMEEILEGHKTCRDCRRAVEAFKAILICEDEEKEK